MSALLSATLLLPACVPVLLAGAATGGVAVAVDRRSSGAQLDDKSIELRAGSFMRGMLPSNAHINVNSYNRKVLITGEVPRAEDKITAERAIRTIPAVQGVVNELAVQRASALSERASDTWITTRVKSLYLNSRELSVSAISVMTERGVVYLMGLLTPGEGKRAAELASGVPGVTKVVALFETITVAQRDEILRVGPKDAVTPAPGLASPAVTPP
ncbi:BON domain-containing protein [Amphibiibacter pelophylacis]|uniref:BON domain-containing protein n=1 Tax=Amphibiibacter pelophylacis TaxID=1799477 RepID=UPI003BFA7747